VQSRIKIFRILTPAGDRRPPSLHGIARPFVDPAKRRTHRRQIGKRCAVETRAEGGGSLGELLSVVNAVIAGLAAVYAATMSVIVTACTGVAVCGFVSAASMIRSRRVTRLSVPAGRCPHCPESVAAKLPRDAQQPLIEVG
jgi:hypothetical protein